MLRSVFVFILVLSGALVLPVRAEVGVQGFDGRWKMTQTCPASGRSPGLANYLILQIKDGHAIGETGTRGQPGWRSVDGQIQANGNAELSYSGLVKEPEVGPQEVAMGKPYDFLIQAHFDTTIGTGTRTKYRICSFAFNKFPTDEPGVLRVPGTAMPQIPGPSLSSHAQGVAYGWSGPGNVIGLLDPFAGPKLGGQENCAWRTAEIDVLVDGIGVRGLFRRKGRPPIPFQASLAPDGSFKTEVKYEQYVRSDLSHHETSMHDLGLGHAPSGIDDGLWHLTGVIAEGKSHIRVEGPCVYEGPLTKK